FRVEARPGRNCRSEVGFEPGARGGSIPGRTRNRRGDVRDWVFAGSGQLGTGNCGTRSGRPWTSGPRLLHQGRCQVERNTRTLSKARRQDISIGGGFTGNCPEERRNGHAYRDETGESFANPGAAPRSVQFEAQNVSGPTARIGATIRLASLLPFSKRPAFRRGERGVA